MQNKTARLAVLQRIELASPFLLKIRKLFGRYIFSNIITKYFLNPKLISQEYYKMMQEEFLIIKKFISSNDNFFLGIGSGIGGLELLINQNFKDTGETIMDIFEKTNLLNDSYLLESTFHKESTVYLPKIISNQILKKDLEILN